MTAPTTRSSPLAALKSALAPARSPAAQATLGAAKLGSGLDALEYYRAGDWDRLERYCLEDVKLTRDLYEYARKYGQLFFQKGPRRAPVPMSFAVSPFAPLLRAQAWRANSRSAGKLACTR